MLLVARQHLLLGQCVPPFHREIPPPVPDPLPLVLQPSRYLGALQACCVCQPLLLCSGRKRCDPVFVPSHPSLEHADLVVREPTSGGSALDAAPVKPRLVLKWLVKEQRGLTIRQLHLEETRQGFFCHGMGIRLEHLLRVCSVLHGLLPDAEQVTSDLWGNKFLNGCDSRFCCCS